MMQSNETADQQQEEMHTVNDSDALKSLIDSIPGKTLAAKLRGVMPEIDKRVREGVQHEEIIETLNASGFDLKLNTFRSYLYRYRKKLQQQPESTEKVKLAKNADGNLQAKSTATEDKTSSSETAETSESSDTLEAIFDARNRGSLGNKYMQRPQTLGKKRS